jgi:hypothetical protein
MFINARTGNSNIYADLSRPLKKGIRKAPMINIAAGGTELIIIIFLSFNQ